MDDELLSAFVDGALNEQERRQVIRRLCRDAAWRSRYERYLLIGAALRQERPLWRPELLSAAVARQLALQTRKQAGRVAVQPPGSRRDVAHARRMPARTSAEVTGRRPMGPPAARALFAVVALLAMVVGVGYFRVFEGIDGSSPGGEALPASPVAEVTRGGYGNSSPVSQVSYQGGAGPVTVGQAMLPGQDGEPPGMQFIPMTDSDVLMLADEGSLLGWQALLDPSVMLTTDPLGSNEPSASVPDGGGDPSEPRSGPEAGDLAMPRITQVQDGGFSQ